MVLVGWFSKIRLVAILFDGCIKSIEVVVFNIGITSSHITCIYNDVNYRLARLENRGSR